MKLASLLALAACSAPASNPSAMSGSMAPQPTPPPAATPKPVPPAPPIDALYDAWIDAVIARDVGRIDALLALPVSIYFDDGLSATRRPAACPEVRKLHRLTTATERTAFATCIAATVFHAKASDPTHPIGIVPLDRLTPLIDAPVHDQLTARAGDHDFVHGHSVIGSEFDFTLAVPRNGDGRADLVVLTSWPGC